LSSTVAPHFAQQLRSFAAGQVVSLGKIKAQFGCVMQIALWRVLMQRKMEKKALCPANSSAELWLNGALQWLRISPRTGRWLNGRKTRAVTFTSLGITVDGVMSVGVSLQSADSHA
jgi:hypothetical protein